MVVEAQQHEAEVLLRTEHAVARVLAEGACPACLALGLGRARAGRNRTRRIVGPLPGG